MTGRDRRRTGGAPVFDASYYDRYYVDPGTRVAGPDEIEAQGEFICAYLRHVGLPVRRVLDMGCGLGLLRPILARHFPSLRYVGVEWSEHLCEAFGWERGSVADYRARRPFDLVICQDVVQYLPDRKAASAITNLADACRGALYFGALTIGDWERNCDQSRTDDNCYMRTADWYRRRLRRHFVSLGGGLHLKRDSHAVLYELEISG